MTSAEALFTKANGPLTLNKARWYNTDMASGGWKMELTFTTGCGAKACDVALESRQISAKKGGTWGSGTMTCRMDLELK